MSRAYFKKLIDCTCHSYCNEQNLFIYVIDGTSDTNSIYHQYHVNDPKSKLMSLGTFSDEDIKALVTVLNAEKESDEVNSDDLLKIAEARK
jgi:hypothetical protein